MKIAFLTPEFPHPKTGTAGGIGTSILNLSKGLIRLGIEVTVIVYGQGKDEFFTDEGISFYKVKNIKIKGFSRFFTQKKIQKLINQLVNKNKIDLIEAPDWTGFTSNIKPNCPVVIKLHGSDTYFCHLDKRPVKFFNKYFEKKALKNAIGFISVSTFTAKITNQLFQLNKDFEIIPNGIDVDNFSLGVENQSEESTILYFGTLIRKKGLLELPLIFNEVFKKNNKVKLLLIGRDASDISTGNKSTWKMMQTLFDSDALRNVDYIGSVPYDKIKKYISSSTVCVFPTFAEAFPVSWLEAMAMKKAIVASDIGWANEVIDDSLNGFLVNPKNHYEFAEKIMRLLDNKDIREPFGEAARQKVEQKFSLEVIASRSENYYKKILNITYD